MQSNLAPIGISTRSRTHHLKQVIDALKKNLLASDSEVYIFSDAPKSGDKVIVGEVRKYIHTITGFFPSIFLAYAKPLLASLPKTHHDKKSRIAKVLFNPEGTQTLFEESPTLPKKCLILAAKQDPIVITLLYLLRTADSGTWPWIACSMTESIDSENCVGLRFILASSLIMFAHQQELYISDAVDTALTQGYGN